jgi:uncharacterized protein
MLRKKRKRTGIAYIRAALIACGLAIPALSLLPLGSVWLWQNGYLVHWALAACVTTGIAWAVQAYILPKEQGATPPIPDEAQPGPKSARTPLEERAWDEVRQLATTTSPEALYSRDGALQVAVTVVERVAKVMRPDTEDPVWHFTAPEVLAVVEQVSRRLRSFIEETVPLGDRLTIAQALQLYRWRGLVEAAQTAHDVWRIVRLLNPVTALTHEVRERISGQLLRWSKEHVSRRIVEVYVEEVGVAAIDLYSGRLRTAPRPRPEDDLAEVAPDVPKDDAAPLRLFVGGQVNAGKSRLVNALGSEAGAAVDLVPTTTAFSVYALGREDLPGAVIVDSPGLGTAAEQQRATVDMAASCDLVIWVVAAHRADREIDRTALAELRRHFADRPDRRPPPLLLVLSHVDQLRPWHEWKPPYELAAASQPKAISIRDAIAAAATDLDFKVEDVVPVCLDPAVGLYNVDAVWGRILDLVPDARQTSLLRLLRQRQSERRWGRLWRQAANAGRVVAGEVLRRRGGGDSQR